MKPELILPPPSRMRSAISALALITAVWVIVIALIAGAIRTIEYAAAQPEIRHAFIREVGRVVLDQGSAVGECLGAVRE